MQNHLRSISLSLALSVFFLFSLLIASEAMARKDGITGYSGRFGATCGACHAPGPSNGLPPPPVVAPLPTVTLVGPTQVTAGTTNTYQVTMSGGVVPNGDGGLNLSVTAGQLVATALNTQVLNNELAHKTNPPFYNPTFVDSAGRITWTFDWQAPSVNGTETMYVTVLSGNGDYGFYGDRVGATTLAINVLGGAAQAPVARPGGPYTGVVGTAVALNGSTSSDGDGTVVSYSWDFGDGTIGVGATPGHVYTAAGLYTTTLTVTDNSGLTGSATTTVNIGTSTPPPPVIDGLALYNTNCAGCHGAAPGTKANRTAAQIQNAIVTLAVMQSPTLTALSAAQVQAIATAIQTSGPAPQPPVAVPAGPYTGLINAPIAFNGGGSYDPDGLVMSYSWGFGDGASATGATPTHAYASVGLYTVTLTVTDNGGLTTVASTTANIGVGTPPPPVIDGLALYNANCAGCHGAAPGTKAGRTTAQIQNSILTVSAMITPALQALTPDQIQAISAAIGGGTPPPTPTDGKGLYDSYCSSCHGAGGSGGSGGGVKRESASSILEAIDDEREMAFLKGSLSSAQISLIANYLSGSTTPPPPPPPGSTDGLTLYTSYCASCHGAAPGTKAGRTSAQISVAITNVNVMNTTSLRALTAAQINAITAAISSGTPPPMPTTGQGMYDMSCLSCHGVRGGGGSGGNIRGDSASSIREAITDERLMRYLQGVYTQDQMRKIASYIAR